MRDKRWLGWGEREQMIVSLHVPQGKNRKTGIGRDGILLLLSMAPAWWLMPLCFVTVFLSVSWSRAENPSRVCWIVSKIYVFPSNAHMATWLCVYVYLFLLARKPCLCVHIHIPVHVGPCVETYLFALWNQVQCSPRGPFCFMSWGSKNSLANSIQLQLQHQPQPSPVTVPEAGYWTEGARSVCGRLSEWWLMVGRPT